MDILSSFAVGVGYVTLVTVSIVWLISMLINWKLLFATDGALEDMVNKDDGIKIGTMTKVLMVLSGPFFLAVACNAKMECPRCKKDLKCSMCVDTVDPC